ncbi:5'-3' exoribonuclease 2 homolog [Anthonomus grandis grandis]|uniref:5'-3' exoribonuclease 2 homolog n=1 Tax=Anthonomus grandis grandis TaxID=2921223 RepID=UPI0021659205|nr:5'-3' exoribonuclease 2 homolog [Anthonomus grandis grandis]
MGVPAFFRWLSRKYPSVIVHCVEQKAVDINGTRIPTDSSEPNPNGIEFDNLYLDMNGIIHPCTHPEDRPAPKNEDEMMIAIFDCIDRLFNIVRPRKLLYMAIDGVAPRAKMNQQRSRRFRASKETYEKINEIKRIRADLLLKGCVLPPEKPKEEHFDSNCITPGTPFMARLSECLDYYIHDRLNNDPGWKGIKVILSDANVPGEGEHKIMDYIRKQRAQPDHDPNTQHVLCGADADLIMLGLATHEPNFTIIREEFKPNKPRPCEICGQLGHEMKDCVGGVRSEHGQDPEVPITGETDFIFVRLNVLREYLEKELAMPNLPFKYEFDRVLDDWVFMCFFVGNDFLPHLPSLEIRENAIDRLIRLYKDCVYKTGGYLTDSGDVNLERVQMIMVELGKAEDEIFKNRQQRELQFKAREKAKKRRSDGFNEYRPNLALLNNTQFAPKALGQHSAVQNARQEAFNIRKAGMHSQAGARTALESMFRKEGDSGNDNRRGEKRKHEEEEETATVEDEESDDDQAHDEVRLWEDGFKDRYYESKFDVGPDHLEFRYSVALHYVRGLCWVLKYYYQGCASWKWYYPYHYAPFASDFCNIAGLSTEFEQDTKPFNPLEQLMGVFPAASSKHVPEPWAPLMSDPDSPIIDFYPEDFKIDLNGKKFAWQGVALLPFVEEKRLFKALEPYYGKLSEAERKRNVRGDDRLYVSTRNEGYDLLSNLYTQSVEKESECAVVIQGMKGTVLVSEECLSRECDTLRSPVKGLPAIVGNIVVCVRFRDPKYTKGFKFPAKRLKGAKEPPRVLKPQDLDPQANRHWRSQVGMVPATQRANLGGAGHRMLGHYVRHDQKRDYASIPPPSSLDHRNRNYGGGGTGYNRSSYPHQQDNYHHREGGRGRGGYYNNQRGGYGGGNYGNQYQQQHYNNRNHNNGRDEERRPGPYRDRYVSDNNTNRYSYRR